MSFKFEGNSSIVPRSFLPFSLILLLIGLLFFIYIPEKDYRPLLLDGTVVQGFKNQSNHVDSNNLADFSLMIYMVGSNLGDDAEADINEMIKANLTDPKINLILQTGGGTEKNFTTIKRYNFSDGISMVNDLGKEDSMGDEKTLYSFINWSMKEYPAKKYGLILWDHGNGITGFGNDPNFDDDVLHLSEIKSLRKYLTGVLNYTNLEFIGFDSCLMGTIEVASVLGNGSEPLSKYLISSEEIVPNWGWNYTNIIEFLSANSSSSGESLGKSIIQSYMDDSKKRSKELQFHADRDITLSVLDLTKISGLNKKLDNLVLGLRSEISDGSSNIRLLKAVDTSEHFGQSASNDYMKSTYGSIDVNDFLANLEIAFPSLKDQIDNVREEMESLIVHSKAGESHPNAHGISIYFPLTEEEFNNMNNMDQSNSIPVQLYSRIWHTLLNETKRYVNQDTNFPPLVKSREDNGLVNVSIIRPDIQRVVVQSVLKSDRGLPITYLQSFNPLNIKDGYFIHNVSSMLSLCEGMNCIPISTVNDVTRNTTKYYVNVEKIARDKTQSNPTLVFEYQNGQFTFLGGATGIESKGGGTVAKEKIHIEAGDLIYGQGIADTIFSENLTKSRFENQPFLVEDGISVARDLKVLEEGFIRDRYLNVSDPSRVTLNETLVPTPSSVRLYFCDYSENCERTRVYNLGEEVNTMNQVSDNKSGISLMRTPDKSKYVYSNYDFDFQLDYPSSWFSMTQDIDNENITLNDPIVLSIFSLEDVKRVNLPSNRDMPTVRIVVQDVNPMEMDLFRNSSFPEKDYLERYFNLIDRKISPNFNITDGRPISEALFVDNAAGEGRHLYMYATIMNGKMYLFIFESEKSLFADRLSQVKKMINTNRPIETKILELEQKGYEIIDEKERLRTIRALMTDGNRIIWPKYSVEESNFTVSLPTFKGEKNDVSSGSCPEYERICHYMLANLPHFSSSDGELPEETPNIIILIVNSSEISSNLDSYEEKLRLHQLSNEPGFPSGIGWFESMRNKFSYKLLNSELVPFLNDSYAIIDTQTYLEPGYRHLAFNSHMYTLHDGKFISISLLSPADSDYHRSWFENITRSFNFVN